MKVGSDEALLHLIAAQRDPAALEALYDRYAQTVNNLVHRIVKDSAVADEISQETLAEVWQKAGEFSGRGSVAGWIFRIARNKSLDQLEPQKDLPQPVPTASAEADHALRGQPGTVGTLVGAVTIERHMSDQRAREALAQIPPEERECLEMAYFDGLTLKQIARYTRMPLETVKTRLRAGLEKLGPIFRRG